MNNMFLNRSQNRLRAGWRIVIYFILFFAIFLLTNVLIQALIPIRLLRSILSILVSAGIILGTLWLAGRYLDHRKFKEYGFILSKRWWFDFTFGILLSALLIYIVFLFEKAMDWVEIVDYFQNQRDGYIGMPFVIPLIMGLFFYIFVGLYEEILFRAYTITNLSQGLNKKSAMAKKALIWAYLLSAVIFGLLHSGNTSITLVGVINLILLGLFLGLPYILSGELAMPIALHFSWNIFQGLLFGFPVSGEYNHLSVIAIAQSGPQLWTGGAFGPEGGLIGSFALVVGCALILLWFKILQSPISVFIKLADYNVPNLPKNDISLIDNPI